MYSCFADVERSCAGRGIAPARLFLENEMRLTGRTEKEIYDMMDARLTIMEDAANRALNGPLGSVGGLIDGLAQTQWRYAGGAQTLCGAFLNRVMARALSCSEVNASMGRICAAPTAGSCGILPAVLLTMQEEYALPRRAVLDALLTASGFGAVVMKNATVAGAEGGCQAECGSAAAMAAAALVYLRGGSASQSVDAACFAIMNLLGLVCDPVGGLVEVPCVYRNVGSCGIAFTAADLALAGISCPIDPDEVLIAMKDVGDALPQSLRETGEGGCASCPSVCAKLNNK